MNFCSTHNNNFRSYIFKNEDLKNIANILDNYIQNYEMKGLLNESSSTRSLYLFSQHIEILFTSFDLIVSLDDTLDKLNLIAAAAIAKTLVEYFLKYSFMSTHDYNKEARKAFDDFHSAKNIELWKLADKASNTLTGTPLEGFKIEKDSLDILNNYSHLNGMIFLADHAKLIYRNGEAQSKVKAIISIINKVLEQLIAITIIYKYFYLTSNDYQYHLEMELTPEEGTQYIVSPWFLEFLQENPKWQEVLLCITINVDDSIRFNPPFE